MSKCRRTALVLTVFAIMLTWVGFAGADTSGPHGKYTSDTSTCAQCHRTHTSNANNLIKFVLTGNGNATYKTCIYCHSSVGQSKYDVVDGMIKGTTGNYAANGGGFENMTVIEGTAEVVETVYTTSRHDVANPEGTKVAAPGGSQREAGKIEMTCTSCHNLHGSTNSRLLRTVIATVYSDDTVREIDTSGVVVSVYGELENETVAYNDAMNNFCGACHNDYNVAQVASGDNDSGLFEPSKKRHRVGMPTNTASGFDAAKLILPLTTSENVSCLTCHYAHGSAAQVSAGTDPNGSTLLRLDERGVCQNCHNKFPSLLSLQLADRNPLLEGINATSPDNRTAVITFNGYLERVGAEIVDNYRLTGPEGGVYQIDRARLQPDGKSVVFNVYPDMEKTGTYTLTVANSTYQQVRDTNFVPVGEFGNWVTFNK